MFTFKKLPMAVFAVLVLFFTGCDLPFPVKESPAASIAVKGTWEIPGDYPESWIITESTLTYAAFGGYTADIVDYSNAGLNGGDTSITPDGSSKGTGYAVIRFTKVSGAGDGQVGKYQIFRWAENLQDPAKRDFSQGYKQANENYDNTVFDTPEAARAGATNAGGHFAFASQGASRKP